MKGRTPWNKGYKETRPEVLKNIQDAALARPEQSKESRELQASKTRGQKRTDEQKANLSRGQKGVKKGPMKQEHKDKRSKKLKGIKKADSVVENMKKRVQERLAEGSHPTKIRVSCIKTQKEYSLTTFMRYVVNGKPGPRAKVK